MPNTLKSTPAAKQRKAKSKAIKALNREVARLDRLIAAHGDLPIGTPESDNTAPASNDDQQEDHHGR